MAERTPLVKVDGQWKPLPEGDTVAGLATTAEIEAKVPETPASPTTKFLRGDGTWAEIVGGSGLSHAQAMSRVSIGF